MHRKPPKHAANTGRGMTQHASPNTPEEASARNGAPLDR